MLKRLPVFVLFFITLDRGAEHNGMDAIAYGRRVRFAK